MTAWPAFRQVLPVSWALLTVFASASAVAARGVQTLLHVNPDAEINTRIQLDLEMIDSFGSPVPWGDLHMHHGRRMHVYVLHEVRVIIMSTENLWHA